MRPLHLAGDGPDKGRHLAGERDDDLVDLLAPGDQAAVALPESALGLPTEVLDRLGHLFQPQLRVAADLSGVAVGPGSLDEDAPGVGVSRLGEAPLTVVLARGAFTRDETRFWCKSGESLLNRHHELFGQ